MLRVIIPPTLIKNMAKKSNPNKIKPESVLDELLDDIDKIIESSTLPESGNLKLVRQNELANMFGVTQNILKRWIELGCPNLPDPANRDRYLFNVSAVFRWFSIYSMQKVAQRVKELDEVFIDVVTALEADRRLKVAKALREELGYVKDQQLVANIDDLLENFRVAASEIRANLMSWTSRLPGLLAMKSEEYIADLLDEEITGVLTPLSEHEHEYVDTQR